VWEVGLLSTRLDEVLVVVITASPPTKVARE